MAISCVCMYHIDTKSVSAHAYVVKSNPTENETLKKAPSVVKLNLMRIYKFRILIHCL